MYQSANGIIYNQVNFAFAIGKKKLFREMFTQCGIGLKKGFVEYAKEIELIPYDNRSVHQLDDVII